MNRSSTKGSSFADLAMAHSMLGDPSVRDFKELVCWQLSHELKCYVDDLTSEGRVAKDFEFRDQIRSSSASAPANIAEGFGAFRPAEFARFLGYAVASLDETRNHLIGARDQEYIDESTYQRLQNLAVVAKRATANLKRDRERRAAEEREGKRKALRPRRNKSSP